MNYRALEDLISILVKKSGYKITDLKLLEDSDYLDTRKAYLIEEINNIKSKLDTFTYNDSDNKVKDEEEKKYLLDKLNDLRNSKNELELKLNDKTLKCMAKVNISSDIEVIDKEILSIEELIKVVDYKLDNFSYESMVKSKDIFYLNTLEKELSLINDSINNKEKNSIYLGNQLLNAFKNNKPINEVSELLSILVDNAKTNYSHTLEEIKGSNIFEVIDTYNNKKSTVISALDNNEYSNDAIKDSLLGKVKYHNKRIETFRSTINEIERRKEELSSLINESNTLFLDIKVERLKKEERLKKLESILYSQANLDEEYSNIINLLIDEINNDKYLENKYMFDIESFKEELRNLDINYNNLHKEITMEQRSLEILNNRIDNEGLDTFGKFEDKVKLIEYTNRIESLYNEQQYLYVNVDVIKEEIESIWARGNDEKKIPLVEDQLVLTSMYDEEETSSEEPIKEEIVEDDFLEDIDYFE